MSDAKTPESPVPASETPAEPVVVTETPAEPVVVTDTPPEPVVVETPAATVAEQRAPAATPVVVEKKKRGVGAWSFVLGLLTVIIDIAFVVFVVVVVIGAIGDLSAGTLNAAPTAIAGAGLVLLALFLLFGGFLSAGVAVLLGLIALIGGRGRVLGLFGLLFGLAAIAARVFLLTAGIISPELG